jgi:hypothetical protein
MQSLLLFFKPSCLVLAQFSSIYLFNLSNLSTCTSQMAQSECNHPRHFDALYTLKFTLDPLINRSLLCKNPRILQGDFQLYQYNIDVMEKIALSVKCSFHFTTFTHTSEQKASSLSSCTSIVFLTKLSYPYTLTFINDTTNINFDPDT